ncbi:MAG: peptide chain release factor 1 [Burkholderiaceae bacterium]
MKDTLRLQFDRLGMRLQELDARLADPASTADMNKFRELSREQAEASEIVELYRRFTQREADRATAHGMLEAGDDDADMVAMAREELAACDADLASLDAALHATLLPRDPDDARPAFVEIRAGSGGEESALFAADLLRMYLRYAERQGWRSEVMSESQSDLGGYKEVVVRLENPSGARGLAAATDGVYGQLRFESGGHRVQRVPATETQGRVHSSACTVAVLAEADPAAEVTLNPSELRIDTYRASGAGGQHINKTDSAIRITHLPTGLVAECQDDRSQHRNKAKAMVVLAARLRDREQTERAAKEAATRKSLIGSGDRSDRIRTYNFPQGRLTDHRINLTLYKLAAVMDGDLSDVVAALQAARAAEQLAQLEAGAG